MLTLYGFLESKWYKLLKWIQKAELFTMVSKMAAI